MSMELSPRKIKQGIKTLMKRKGYTYRNLSTLLDCSLATAKRIMNQEELSLSRMLKILEWLDIDLTELEKLVAETVASSTPFNEEQDVFLGDNPHFLSYLIQLKKGLSPEAIEEEFGISKLSTEKYLLKLEQLELVRVTSKGHIRVPENTPTHFLPHGKLAKLNVKNIVQSSQNFFYQILENLINKNPATYDKKEDEKSNYAVSSFKVTPKTYAEFTEKIGKTIHDFQTIAKSEAKIRDESELKSAVVQIAYTILPLDSEELKPLDEVFDRVRNI